jgi:hypothetical protein
MFGVLTSFALFWGLFMNVNFVLAGAVTPSAFYIVIQTALFVANVGAILGLDYLLSRRIGFSFLASQPAGHGRPWRLERGIYLLMVVAAFAIGLVASTYIQDWGPHSVDDPAMLMLVMSVITGMTMLIKALTISGQPGLVSAPEAPSLAEAPRSGLGASRSEPA